ncbi:hypothetical protein R1flu_004783 [Riccia fluitans]|uniref:Uncharacterized protein n=1 Tax=Riccia fluitans TaxID=41844 RepID=A0ABD1YR92_9MARC
MSRTTNQVYDNGEMDPPSAINHGEIMYPDKYAPPAQCPLPTADTPLKLTPPSSSKHGGTISPATDPLPSTTYPYPPSPYLSDYPLRHEHPLHSTMYTPPPAYPYHPGHPDNMGEDNAESPPSGADFGQVISPQLLLLDRISDAPPLILNSHLADIARFPGGRHTKVQVEETSVKNFLLCRRMPFCLQMMSNAQDKRSTHPVVPKVDQTSIFSSIDREGSVRSQLTNCIKSSETGTLAADVVEDPAPNKFAVSSSSVSTGVKA